MSSTRDISMKMKAKYGRAKTEEGKGKGRNEDTAKNDSKLAESLCVDA